MNEIQHYAVGLCLLMPVIGFLAWILGGLQLQAPQVIDVEADEVDE